MPKPKMIKWELCLVHDSTANGFDQWDEWQAPTDEEAVLGWLAEGSTYMNNSDLTKWHKVKIRNTETGKVHTLEAKLGITISKMKEVK